MDYAGFRRGAFRGNPTILARKLMSVLTAEMNPPGLRGSILHGLRDQLHGQIRIPVNDFGKTAMRAAP